MRVLRKPARYGIAIAWDRVVAVSEDSEGHVLCTEQLSPPRTPGEWPELGAAIERLRASMENEIVVGSIALMPGVAHVRPIELPFMRKSELMSVLQRDATTYFFRVQAEQVVAIRHLQRVRGRRTILAAAAPRWLVELLAAQVSGDGVHPPQIVPACAAWACAANDVGKTPSQSTWWLGFRCGETIELLEQRRGDVRQVRRVRAVGDEAIVREITGILPPRAVSIMECETAMALAARYAGRTKSLALVAPSVATAERRQAWRQLSWLLAAAAILLVTSSVLRVVDVIRELAHVRASREQIKPQLARALQVRTNVAGIDRLVSMLCEVRDGTPRWSDAIVTIATHLPLDAHVLQLTSAGDSVALEGAAKRASEVLEELRAAPGIVALHTSAPIRLETNPDGDPTEYFTVVVRVDPTPGRGRQP